MYLVSCFWLSPVFSKKSGLKPDFLMAFDPSILLRVNRLREKLFLIRSLYNRRGRRFLFQFGKPKFVIFKRIRVFG